MTTETIPAGLLRTQHGRVYLNDKNAWLRYVRKLYKARGEGKHNVFPERFPCLIETKVLRYRISEERVYEHRIFYREDIEAEIARCKVWLQRFYDPTKIVAEETAA